MHGYLINISSHFSFRLSVVSLTSPAGFVAVIRLIKLIYFKNYLPERIMIDRITGVIKRPCNYSIAYLSLINEPQGSMLFGRLVLKSTAVQQVFWLSLLIGSFMGNSVSISECMSDKVKCFTCLSCDSHEYANIFCQGFGRILAIFPLPKRVML